jgi:hypothetical protein
LGVFETILGIAVVGLAAWLLLGSSPRGRLPRLEQQDRFVGRGETALRRRSN